MFFRRARATPRSQELVFLDADDDLGTIRSKLEASSSEEIYLVLPRRSSVLRTPLEFRMLARIANEMSSETILVTDDSSRRRLAGQEGFRTRRSLRTLKHLMVAPDQRPPRLVVPDWVPLPSFTGFLTFVGIVFVASVGVFVLYPEMRVTLVPQSSPVTRSVDVTVDPTAQSADPTTATMPGEVLTTTVEVTDSIPIPSDRTVGQDRARGEVVITSERPGSFTVPRGTVVRVDNGARFVLDQDRPVQTGIPVRVGITAADGGTGGNVGPGQITRFDGPNLERLQVVNQRATAGGTDRVAKIVTEEDHATLREHLNAQARERGLAALQVRSGPDRTMPEASLSIAKGEEQFEQRVGAEADRLVGRLTAAVSGTAFVNQAYNDLVGQVLEQSAGGDLRLNGAAEVGTPGVLSVDGRRVMLRSQATGVLGRDINPTGIRDALRGATPQEAQTYLGRLSGLSEPPYIEVSPAWAPRAFRIDVNVRGSQ